MYSMFLWQMFPALLGRDLLKDPGAVLDRLCARPGMAAAAIRRHQPRLDNIDLRRPGFSAALRSSEESFALALAVAPLGGKLGVENEIMRRATIAGRHDVIEVLETTGNQPTPVTHLAPEEILDAILRCPDPVGDRLVGDLCAPEEMSRALGTLYHAALRGEDMAASLLLGAGIDPADLPAAIDHGALSRASTASPSRLGRAIFAPTAHGALRAQAIASQPPLDNAHARGAAIRKAIDPQA